MAMPVEAIARPLREPMIPKRLFDDVSRPDHVSPRQEYPFFEDKPEFWMPKEHFKHEDFMGLEQKNIEKKDDGDFMGLEQKNMEKKGDGDFMGLAQKNIEKKGDVEIRTEIDSDSPHGNDVDELVTPKPKRQKNDSQCLSWLAEQHNMYPTPSSHASAQSLLDEEQMGCDFTSYCTVCVKHVY